MYDNIKVQHFYEIHYNEYKINPLLLESTVDDSESSFAYWYMSIWIQT